MSDDKTTKPEPPTVPSVLVAHGAMFEALARLPDARNRADRDAIHEAIGFGHKTLMEAASYRQPTAERDFNESVYLGIGRQASAAMDYTINRVRQLPTLGGDLAATCASILADAAKAWGNLGLLLDMLPGGPTPERNVIRELAQECQQAYDGWRVQQPATDEPCPVPDTPVENDVVPDEHGK